MTFFGTYINISKPLKSRKIIFFLHPPGLALGFQLFIFLGYVVFIENQRFKMATHDTSMHRHRLIVMQKFLLIDVEEMIFKARKNMRISFRYEGSEAYQVVVCKNILGRILTRILNGSAKQVSWKMMILDSSLRIGTRTRSYRRPSWIISSW